MLYSMRNPHLQKYPNFVNSCSVLERRTGSLLVATSIIKNGRHCAREGNVVSYELECFVFRAHSVEQRRVSYRQVWTMA